MCVLINGHAGIRVFGVLFGDGGVCLCCCSFIVWVDVPLGEWGGLAAVTCVLWYAMVVVSGHISMVVAVSSSCPGAV